MDKSKTPISELPKEELLIKYNKLLAIARQSKQAKDESATELAKSKESEIKLKMEIAALQEVLQTSTEKQTQLAEVDNKIKIMSVQNEELIRKIDGITNEKKQLLHASKENVEKIEFLQERILNDADKLEKIEYEKSSLETKNQQLIEKIKMTEDKNKLLELSFAEFKEKYLEEKRLSSTLETVLNKLEEKSEKSLSERSESRNGLQTVPETLELEESVQENEKYKSIIEALNKDIEKYQMELTTANSSFKQLENSFRDCVVKCLSHVKTMQETAVVACNDFEAIVAESVSSKALLEISQGKLHSLESKLRELTDINKYLTSDVEEAMECNKDLKDEINHLKAALEHKSFDENAQKIKEINKYQTVIDELKRELKTLREDNQAADDKFTSLENRFTESTRVSEQLEALASNRCEEYNSLKFKADAYDKLFPVLSTLRSDAQNIHQVFDCFKSGVICDLGTTKKDQKHLENNLLRAVEDYEKKLLDNNGELLNEMNVMNQELKERGETISKMEETNSSLQADANETQSKIKKITADLENSDGRVMVLRNELDARERVVRDLEEEVARLRSTDTQVDTLSTSTISKAEESQRLVDLDQSFEEKYNKLKVLAMKLKKKMVELQSELDQERDKLKKERTEFQDKILGLQKQAQALNSLKANYDALLEKNEKEGKDLGHLRMGLKKACDENISLKQLVDEFESSRAVFKNEKTTFEIIKKELSAQIQTLKKNLEKEQGKVKEWDKERERLEQEQVAVCYKLDDEKSKHKLTLQALEEEKQKQKKQSLLSLEMADYERIVNELGKKLEVKEAQISQLSASLDTQRELSSTLQATVVGLEQRVSAEQATADISKSRQNQLQDELRTVRQELENKSCQVSDSERSCYEQSLEFDALKLENSNIAAEKAQLEDKMGTLQRSTKTELRNLEDQHSQLKINLDRRESELEELKREFEKYKVRSEGVLRSLQGSGSLSKTQDIEVEVVQLRASCQSLQTKFDDAIKRLQLITDDHGKTVEEKARLVKKVQELQADNCQLNAKNAQLQIAEQTVREQYEESVRLLPVQQETLAQCFKREIEELELRHRSELETARAGQQQAEKALSLHVGRQTPPSHHRRQPSSGSGETAHRRQPSSSFMPVKSERETLDVLMLEREACEGSESVESSSPKILPLEQLLSPQPSNAAANNSHLTEKLERSENRIQHLTSLLSDAESDAARLQQLNQVLKEEIRRKERNVAREEHSDNLEYLKNIVVKFGTLPRGDERLRLVPVLNTILKFSKEEEQRMYAAARGEANGANWGSYLGGMWSATQ